MSDSLRRDALQRRPRDGQRGFAEVEDLFTWMRSITRHDKEGAEHHARAAAVRLFALQSSGSGGSRHFGAIQIAHARYVQGRYS